MKLLYITKDNRAQMGKDEQSLQHAIGPLDDRPRIYLSYHPDDFPRLGQIVDWILHTIDCVIYYYDYKENGEPDPDELKRMLQKMQLFVIPVTERFLGGDCAAFDVEFPYAKESHALILPLLTDIELAERFNEVCGNLQCLSEKNDRDPTAIRFREKLERFLKDHVTDAETAKRIRNAFDKRIFLSYRKMDRRQAQKLMRQIHEHPQCQDIAIWYDEYLTAGKPFDEEIEKTLKDADLVAFLVTGNLFKPNAEGNENYVKSTEYPKAVEIKQEAQETEALLAVESEENQWEQFQKDFPAIRDYIQKSDRETVPEVLLKKLGKADAPESDPERKYLIGLAYLSGIGVERNAVLAVNWIDDASNAGLGEAKKKLADMYYTGNGVERDLDEAIRRQEEYVAFLQERAHGNEIKLIEERNCLVYYYQEAQEATFDEKAIETLQLNIAYAEQFAMQDTEQDLLLLCRMYAHAGMIYDYFGDRVNAGTYYGNAAKKIFRLEYLYPGKHTRDLAATSALAGSFYHVQHQPELAKKCIDLAKQAVKALAELDESLYGGDLAVIYSLAAQIYSQVEPNEAFALFEAAISKLKRLAQKDVERYSGHLAMALNKAGIFYCEQARQNKAKAKEWQNKAETFLKASQDLYERLNREKRGKYTAELASLYNNLGTFCGDIGRLDDAKNWLHDAVNLLEKPGRETPARYLGILAYSCMNLGYAYKELAKSRQKKGAKKSKRDAGYWFRKSLVHYQKAAKNGSMEYIDGWVQCYQELINNYSEQGKDAFQYRMDAIEFLEPMKNRDDCLNALLAESYLSVGSTYFYKQKKPEIALTYCENARVLYENLPQDNEQSKTMALALAYNLESDCYDEMGEKQQSILFARSADKYCNQLAKDAPKLYYDNMKQVHNIIKTRIDYDIHTETD